jgi:hypothetical protein
MFPYYFTPAVGILQPQAFWQETSPPEFVDNLCVISTDIIGKHSG